MTTCYLIRHGETDWNVQGIWQGQADIPLNDMGRAQAHRLAAYLLEAGIHFDAIYSSDLQRSWETATIVAAALGITPQPLIALREIDVGAWSAKTRAEVIAYNPALYQRFVAGEDVRRGDTGETFSELSQRAAAAIEQIAVAYPAGQVACFSHGGPIRALIGYAAGDAQLVHGHIGNTSITIMHRTASGWDLGVVNAMQHLGNIDQAIDMMSAPPDDAETPL
ncbi:MAG TPA: histidine phosphatase family protein [Roseiflexaceae bacterium]|nr:histidine phosphatase family protein [Roseiflexaceae bacterium]HMP39003.1 histidine phosphatase family protein [Roseiflexaceae bacterium]